MFITYPDERPTADMVALGLFNMARGVFFSNAITAKVGSVVAITTVLTLLFR